MWLKVKLSVLNQIDNHAIFGIFHSKKLYESKFSTSMKKDDQKMLQGLHSIDGNHHCSLCDFLRLKYKSLLEVQKDVCFFSLRSVRNQISACNGRKINKLDGEKAY